MKNKKLHSTIKKIIDVVINTPFLEVKTEKGWEPVQSLNITKKQQKPLVKILTEQRNRLVCTNDHILIDSDGNEFFAKDGLGKVIKSDNKPKSDKIISVEPIFKKTRVYDLSLANNTSHCYYTNHILSHNCVVLDEYAFLAPNLADKLFTALYPTISSSKESKMIIVSTPNGQNQFYDLWQKATAKNNQANNTEGWKAFEMNWWDVPGRDEDFKKMTIASIGEERWNQEFACEFLSSSAYRRLLPDEVLGRLKTKFEELTELGLVEGNTQTISTDNKEYKFTQWQVFNSNHTYMAAGDISEGIGGDYSVLYVWDVTDLTNIKQCLKFASNTISVPEYAYVANRLLSLYANPVFIAESNGVGKGVLDLLRFQYAYPNLVKEGKNNDVGIRAHNSVKTQACLWLKDMCTTPECFNWEIYDGKLLKEMMGFIQKTTTSKGMWGTFQAMHGFHDDLMMTFVWAAYTINPKVVYKYFNVVQESTSLLGDIYPKHLKPLIPYSTAEVRKLLSDPININMIDYLDKNKNKLQAASNNNQKLNSFSFSASSAAGPSSSVFQDPFLVERQAQADLQPPEDNINARFNRYFYVDDDDFDGDSW